MMNAEPIVGGYGDVPVELARKLADLLDEIPARVPQFERFNNGRTALFWYLIGILDQAIVKTEES